MQWFKSVWLLASLLLLLTQGCRGILGLIDTPEGVANQYIVQVYHLQFSQIPLIAKDNALLQAALMEGFADSLTEEERKRYQNSDLIVKELTLLANGAEALAHYQVTFQDGVTVENHLTLKLEDKRWWVVNIDKPLRPTKPIYYYLES